MTSPIARAALDYVSRGFSVIPTRRQDKRPLFAWRPYQARRATRPEVVSWFKRWPDAGVAIVCGAISGLAVVDFDPRNGDGLAHLAPRLPRTSTAETGGGGRHYYFRLSPGERISKIPMLLPGTDLQAEASCVIAPPSIHSNGQPYRWCPGLALGEVPPAPLPAVIRQVIALHYAQEREENRAQRGPRFSSALTLDAVLPALRGVRRCGRGYVALCPSHDDREQSLSIAEGEGGKVLLHCFAGCSFADILAALRREAA